MKEYPSIFNQALAPITPGPSSSNTCGPVRISYTCRQIFGKTPSKAIIEFSKDGAYPATYIGMRSDIAFISGLLGKLQTDPEFIQAYPNAKKAGLDVSFNIVDDLDAVCMEAARIILSSDNGDEMIILGDSTGGGTFRIRGIDGCETNIRGDHYELLVFSDIMDKQKLEILSNEITAMLKSVNAVICSVGESYSIIEIKAGYEYDAEFLKSVEKMNGVKKIRTVTPVHPVVCNVDRIPPFDSPEEMVEYCEKNSYSPFEASVKYEAALSGWSEDEVIAYAYKLLDIIKKSADAGMEGNFNMHGIVEPKAKTVAENHKSKRLVPLGFLDLAAPIALGVMEFSNASGTIVCLPTGGSSGIVPGVILAAAKSLDMSEEDEMKALVVAGIAGVCMSKDNDFNGGDYGCQAEVGCGSAMAAAALVQMLGGDAQQVCDAASMALQCQLGLVCDPVAGLVQVPCLARNMTGTAIAAVSANAIMAGFDAVIPFSETTAAMIDLGKRMPAELKGCGGAGCCKTPTGKRLEREQEERNKIIRQ